MGVRKRFAYKSCIPKLEDFSTGSLAFFADVWVKCTVGQMIMLHFEKSPDVGQEKALHINHSKIRGLFHSFLPFLQMCGSNDNVTL